MYNSKNYKNLEFGEFKTFLIWTISKIFQFYKLSYILSVQIIQSNKKMKNKYENKKNRITHLSLF